MYFAGFLLESLLQDPACSPSLCTQVVTMIGANWIAFPAVEVREDKSNHLGAIQDVPS